MDSKKNIGCEQKKTPNNVTTLKKGKVFSTGNYFVAWDLILVRTKTFQTSE